MRRIALLDTETSGLDAASGALLEVAVVEYDVTTATSLRSFASLVRAETNTAADVNGIDVAALGQAPPRDRVIATVRALLADVNAIVAWNAPFDRAWLPELHNRPWLDALDMPWPRPSTSRSLVSVALAHGLGVASAHRALDDTTLMARLFTRAAEMGANLPAMIEHATLPRARYVARLPCERNDELKRHGFRWDLERREWWRSMTEGEAAALPFAASAASNPVGSTRRSTWEP